MNLFLGLKRLFITLAIPGIPLLSYVHYLDMKSQCRAEQGFRFFILAKERVSGDAERMALLGQHLGRLSSTPLEQSVIIARERKILAANDIDELRQQVVRERDEICKETGKDIATGFALIVGSFVAAFIVLFGFLKVGYWIIAGFRKT